MRRSRWRQMLRKRKRGKEDKKRKRGKEDKRQEIKKELGRYD